MFIMFLKSVYYLKTALLIKNSFINQEVLSINCFEIHNQNNHKAPNRHNPFLGLLLVIFGVKNPNNQPKQPYTPGIVQRHKKINLLGPINNG